LYAKLKHDYFYPVGFFDGLCVLYTYRLRGRRVGLRVGRRVGLRVGDLVGSKNLIIVNKYLLSNS